MRVVLPSCSRPRRARPQEDVRERAVTKIKNHVRWHAAESRRETGSRRPHLVGRLEHAQEVDARVVHGLAAVLDQRHVVALPREQQAADRHELGGKGTAGMSARQEGGGCGGRRCAAYAAVLKVEEGLVEVEAVQVDGGVRSSQRRAAAGSGGGQRRRSAVRPAWREG